jgi:hypothetical protein
VSTYCLSNVSDSALELGFRADQARRAAEFSQTLPEATLEERFRAALAFLTRGRFKRAGASTAA